MELFEEIRREYEHGVGTIKGVARKLGVHRRMVREALANAMPTERKKPVREKPKISQARSFVDEIIEADKHVHRKQRHTAHRIWCRLRKEMPGLEISETTVRKYVRKRKQELGLIGREVFIQQSYNWGEEGQIDWYEARAVLDGEEREVQTFCMRSMASGGAFHCSYPHASQQAFLEAHELGFRHFGGVFKTLRYDNLSSAVKRILRGHQREETERFIAFRSHWGFEAEFCTPGRGNEKGGVEGEEGFFRRNHLVPIPRARDMEELNRQLLEGSREDEARVLNGRSERVGEAMIREREYLLPLAREGFQIAEVRFPQVNAKGTVKVLTNFYSVPVAVGVEVCAKVYPAHVEIWHEGRCVARHERSFDRYRQVLNLEHYLEILWKKPGALAGSTALEQWRSQGRWVADYDRFWEELRRRHGKQDGTRIMIEALLLGREHGWSKLEAAVSHAVELSCFDGSALQLLLEADAHEVPANNYLLEIGMLTRYDRPQPQMDEYDRLLREWPGTEVMQ